MIRVGLILFGLAASLWASPGIITDTEVIADSRLGAFQLKAIKIYLERYKGKAATAKNSKDAQSFLGRLYFVSRAACVLEGPRLSCTIVPKLLIKNITIHELPAALLEGELRRKLPLQTGQLISFDENIGTDLMKVVRARIETFLRKAGYYGAQVSVSFAELKQELALEFNINIKQGTFAKVNSVSVEGRSPISHKAVRRHYQRMCLSFNRIFDALSMGSFSCYSRESEREATEDLQERLARLGYVRAQIRVHHQWLDPHDPKSPPSCQKTDALDQISRCVDLRVEIDQGPKVRWLINVHDGNDTSLDGLSRFVRSVFAAERISRATVSEGGDEIPGDQLIIREELEKRINFIESKNIDEQELSLSAKRMTSYLVSRGYTNAEVVTSFIQEDADNILVNFDIYPGRAYYIKNVRIEPSSYAGMINPDELAALNERSFSDSGHFSYDEIEIAKDELIRRLGDKGYSDISSTVEMISLNGGGVEVIFHFTSRAREIVDEIVVFNGFETLNHQIIPSLKNCDSYRVNSEKLCQGSSLVVNDVATDEAKIADFYQANDYVYAKVRSELVRDNDKNKLFFYVYDDRFGQFSKELLHKQNIIDLIISGNFSVHEQVIRRLFPKAVEGHQFDSLSLRKGISNLRESGRFSQIDQKLMAGQENSDDLYFSLQVTERSSLTIDGSLGFSTDQLFMLDAELEESNLFSSMLTLKTKLSLGLFWGRQSSINNKLLWPFIWGKPFSFTLQAPIIVYDDKSHRRDPFRRLQSRMVAGLDWRASANLLPYIKYSLNHTQLEKPPRPIAGERLRTLDGLIPTLQASGKISGVLKPGFSYISLDNPFDPHAGIDLNNWVEINVGPSVGVAPFVNFGTQNRFYIPIGPATLALQASFMRAFIKPNRENFDQLKDISSMDKLGGDRSVRGYPEGEIGISSTDAPTQEYSGYFSNVANIELRFPLTQGGTIGNFFGALFVDQGLLIPCTSVWQCGGKKSLKHIINEQGFGLSVGAGLRYNLPVGPISLDYGISPLDASIWRIHVLFGYAI